MGQGLRDELPGRGGRRARRWERRAQARVAAIVDAVLATLDACPPELLGDVMDRGLVLTGGGALLHGLEQRLKEETGVPVHLTEDPLHSVARGAGMCVEEFETLRRVLVSEPRRR